MLEPFKDPKYRGSWFKVINGNQAYVLLSDHTMNKL